MTESKQVLLLELTKGSRCFTSDVTDWKLTERGVEVESKKQDLSEIFPWANIIVATQTRADKRGGSNGN